MAFNSLDFALFLPVVFALYWFVFNKNLRQQNLLVLVASYVFYGSWDYRFLVLLVFSTLVDYTVGLALGNAKGAKKRKILLWVSLLSNFGLLGVFKYFNFFLDSFSGAFQFFGHELGNSSLIIVLPVGISFYTFQTLSYTIDVYRKKIEPINDLVAFGAFVSFFPQLVAGPIERASNLLPQFQKGREFEYSKAVDGMRQILWGLFKKIVIADNCAHIANAIFNDSANCSGSTILLGAFFFAFQIYGDFSGYSDIAIGISRLFGFDLMQNFAFPYFSRDIAEFWRRWHISLSTWFRDYLYIPLGGSRVSLGKKIRNIFLIFLVSGLWHGANWTFVIWGCLHALYFLPLMLLGRNRNYVGGVASGKTLPSLREVLEISSTFLLVTIAWIFFRAENLTHAMNCISKICSLSLMETPHFQASRLLALFTIINVMFLLVAEWFGRHNKHALEKIGGHLSAPSRQILYLFIFLLICFFQGGKQEFIYFQF